MTRKNTIPAKRVFAEMHKDPGYVRTYAALEEEFALATALIGARAHSGLSQEQLAQRMGTSQSAIARLESGRGRPSTTTLSKLAAATGTKLKVSFEPVEKRG